MKVTGPKTDLRLVRTVGVLTIAIPIRLAAMRHRITVDIATLAIGSALGLASIDVVYVLRRVIDKIYLLDAVAEVVLIIACIIAIEIA